MPRPAFLFKHAPGPLPHTTFLLPPHHPTLAVARRPISPECHHGKFSGSSEFLTAGASPGPLTPRYTFAARSRSYPWDQDAQSAPRRSPPRAPATPSPPDPRRCHLYTAFPPIPSLGKNPQPLSVASALTWTGHSPWNRQCTAHRRAAPRRVAPAATHGFPEWPGGLRMPRWWSTAKPRPKRSSVAPETPSPVILRRGRCTPATSRRRPAPKSS